MKTKVIFRVEKHGGDVLALFPELPGDMNPHATCLCYAHIGQHSAAAVNQTHFYSTPATPDQYADLLQELISIGYDVRISKRATRADLKKRIEATRS